MHTPGRVPGTMPAMNIRSTLALLTISAGLALLGPGCTTAEMKGTPFYTGEHGKRLGPAEQRVNAWPLLYFRDPALSVLWPVFELTDDHVAVRPLFSVYGLDRDRREYNLAWPLVQFDHAHGDSRVFPFFWGRNYRHVVPLYWHFGEPLAERGGSDSLFPLWILSRHESNHLNFWAAWPMVHAWRNPRAGATGSMVLPIYWQERSRNESAFVSLPWMQGDSPDGRWRLLVPLFFHRANETHSALITPLWAAGHSPDRNWRAVIPMAYWDSKQHTLLSPLWAAWQSGRRETYLAPWLLSWAQVEPQRQDVWLAGGLARASWGPQGGAHYAVPFYFRNAGRQQLLTPLAGWDGRAGWFYPLTPLFGLRTNDNRGSWLFPLYSYSRNQKTDRKQLNLLLAGGHSESKSRQHSWFYPLFDFNDLGPLDSETGPNRRYDRFGKDFWCLPWCWYENDCTIRPAPKNPGAEDSSLRDYGFRHGAFPLWSYHAKSTPAENRSSVEGSVLLLLYDYKRENRPGGQSGETNRYTRARVLWRLWHYEKLNDDVSLDVFPGFTHDRKADGFSKTSFLWRLYRSELAPDGRPKLDVLFLPLRR